MKTKLVLLLFSILFTSLSLEVVTGYYYFQSGQNWQLSALYRVFRNRIVRQFDKSDRRSNYNIKVATQSGNPFTNFRALSDIYGITINYEEGYKFHPFITYTGAQTKTKKDVKLDYFGFRNETDLYFAEERDYSLIALTGGSEAAGFSHRVTISQNLEKLLNERYDGYRKFRVLNLAMNSNGISEEINNYVNLAYNQKPELVISHSGWNDIVSGIEVPYNFKKLGLFYPRTLVYWLPRLYAMKDYPQNMVTLSDEGLGLIVDKYLQNLEKYRTIVNANGGVFIAGVQGICEEKIYEQENEHQHIRYDRAIALHSELRDKVSKNHCCFDFSNIKDIHFVDSCHTDEASSMLIAQIYATLIAESNKLAPLSRR